ncbi:MAG TPA: acetate--CoA ligase family protein [Paenalcaligenes sp.]|nr:acetate--CoA ligase family protein [Paenalcaligenes sp.]
MSALECLLNPKKIAIIGASTNPLHAASRPLAYLEQHGYRGTIYPVNPRAKSINGTPCYPSVSALPETPDVAMVVLRHEYTLPAVRQLAEHGTPAAVILSGGYAESGTAGKARQKALVKAAGPMRLLGPNTVGLVNVTDNIPLSASGALATDDLLAGGVSLVSQSGGILGALLSRAKAKGIGLAKLIGTGNEADLGLTDCIEYLIDDPNTRVIILYIESIRNSTAFKKAALRAAEKGKPLVAFKVGQTEAGKHAAASHTGALVGEDALYDALFRQTRVIRVKKFAELLDTAGLLASQHHLNGKKIAILTSTGGAGALVTDSLNLHGFTTPAPDPTTNTKLLKTYQNVLTEIDTNPIDVTLAGLKPKLLREAAQTLLNSADYDALLTIVGSSSLQRPELINKALNGIKHPKPVIAYISPHAPHLVRTLNQQGIPSFTSPDTAASALRTLYDWTQWNAKQWQPKPTHTTPLPEYPAGQLDEQQAKQLFKRFGIQPVREIKITDVDNAAQVIQAAQAAQSLGNKVVVKVLSKQLLHKTEVGGVSIGIPPTEIPHHIKSMQTKIHRLAGFTPRQFLIQEMIENGIELILGFRRDPLGNAIMLGSGGTATELFQDTTIRLLPEYGKLSDSAARSMIYELKSRPLLEGFRGRPKADMNALVQTITAFSKMAVQLGDQLLNCEINPLFVLPQGQGVRAADGVVVLGG